MQAAVTQCFRPHEMIHVRASPFVCSQQDSNLAVRYSTFHLRTQGSCSAWYTGWFQSMVVAEFKTLSTHQWMDKRLYESYVDDLKLCPSYVGGCVCSKAGFGSSQWAVERGCFSK